MIGGKADRIVSAVTTPIVLIGQLARPRNWLSTTITYGLGLGGLLQAILILIGGDPRWSGPSYVTLREIPGAPPSVAAGFALCGLLICGGMLHGRFWVKAVGLFLLAGGYVTFLTAGWVAWAMLPTAGSTGPATYLQLALIVTLMIFVRADSREAGAPVR